MNTLIVGCGYLGRRVASLWRSRGNRVWALTRSAEHAAAFKAAGIVPILGDVSDPATLRSLPTADVALYSVGYDKRSAQSKRAIYVNGLDNVLTEIAERVGRLLYVSSTSVYGQNAGEWVDETSSCTPLADDGRICLAAEQAVWRFFPPRPDDDERLSDRGAIILRFSGIYGPDRLLGRIESLRGNVPMRTNPDGFLNLIHVDDGARIVTELAQRGRIAGTYLVTDDQPVRRREYYGLLARLAGAPEPRYEAPGATAGGLNKRCSNARLRGEFGELLQFPTFESGLPNAIGALPR